MRSIWTIIFFCLGVFHGNSAIADSWELVSQEEMRRYGVGAKQMFRGSRDKPPELAPEIVVKSPETSSKIVSPTDINLVFLPKGGATILPKTFRVEYGALGLDVTERITSRYRPTESGLSVHQAGLPAGRHVFNLFIKDSAGRTGTKKLTVLVQ